MKKKVMYSTGIILIIFITVLLFKNYNINPFQKNILIKKTIEKVKTINISTYQSTRYNHKALFPYDFIIGDPNWGMIISKNDSFLTKEDKFNKYFYYKCKEIGINLHKNKNFFIIETKATAGFNIDNYIKNPIIDFNYDTKTIQLKKPKIEILKIEIVDNIKDINYPDMNITPKEWQQLVTFLIPYIEDKIVKRGILTNSETKSLEFLTAIYQSIGWLKVEFK